MKNFTKLILISLVQLCFVVTINAQDAGDLSATALDFSRTYMGGSARMQALGGAQTALGGDISSASSNPAGLGFFNKSEFSFSPTFNFIGTTSDYLGRSTDASKLNFNFANLGVIINKSKGDLVASKWRGGSFGISINRIADFQNRTAYEGENYYQQDKNGVVLDDPNHPADMIDRAYYDTYFLDNGEVGFDSDIAKLAFYTYIIDTIPTLDGGTVIERNIYQNGDRAYPTQSSPSIQQETINSRGGIYQTSFSYGGNYADRLYFGASLGILSVSREVKRVYQEYIPNTDLASLVLTDEYEINGMGINASFGLIARPFVPLLIGVSYTTPSYYGLEQTRDLTMEVNFVDESFADTESYITNYNITSPSRLRGGITYFIGKNGFITGDVERVNYSGAKLGSANDGSSVDPVTDGNQAINQFEAALNYRVGAEYRFDKFRVRAGYSYLGDPTDDFIDQSESRISLGGGIRTKDFFIDLGVVNSLGTESTISPYPGAPVAEVDRKNTMATFSVGFFF